MKIVFFKELIPVLLIVLFTYTATSKFLDYEKFVFQMRLAPVPFIIPLAPILGWIVPIVEMAIAIVLALGYFSPKLKVTGLYASVILLSAFEVYIATMLLSGSHLPCTCGGIISQMGWKQHLFFNAFFIIGGILTIKYSDKIKALKLDKPSFDTHKDLSRA